MPARAAQNAFGLIRDPPRMEPVLNEKPGLGAAMVMLGEYPPNPTTHSVEKVLPNDKFQGN